MDMRASQPAVEPVPSGTEFTFSLAPTMSFAAEQAGVPLIRSAILRHLGPGALEGGELLLQLEPNLSEPLRIALPTLLPLEERELGVIDLRLPPGRLREVRETERARFTWSIRSGASELASGAEDVQILPYNQWPGLQAPPALLASFVTPNHAVVAQILRRVADRLEAATGKRALDGYQGHDRERVLAMTRALYEEIASLDLAYIGVPASFEAHGQKVRLPDQILAEQLACCLDLSLLFASCLEQMGLAPLIVCVKGHAFPALWLVDDRYPEGLVEDAERMRTQLALGQILAFESTLATGGGSFDEAVASGAKGLQDDEAYLFSLDIRACRSEFRPLPLREVGVAVEEGEAPTPQRIEIVRILRDAQEAPPSEVQQEVEVPEDVASRFRRWQDRLLDLTLRNRLLNFREDGREVLPLEIPDLGAFEDLLATGERLEIIGRPLLYGRDPRDAALAAARRSDEAERARLLGDLARRVVHSRLTQDRLERQTVDLVRAARLDREEGGATTLFVSIGMLKWTEAGNGKERFSPLLLYPVELLFDRRRHRVAIHRLEGEEPIANVTLIEKLRRDFGIDLSALAALDEDEAGLDVDKLLQGVRREIQARPGFEVLDQAHVARLMFSKFLMWKDLEDNAPLLLENPVVRHLASATGVWEDPVGDVAPGTLDDTVAPQALPTVLDADSTQLAAVSAALRGRSFVLQGPPGTGKSQTITNLIAAAVAEGKSVLFVSEKMAALEVVQRRLESVGLGDFCLELHSNKSSKREVLASFGAALDRKTRTQVPRWEDDSVRLGQLRDRLNGYARALHRAHPAGFTAYEASARLRELLDAPEVRIPIEDPASLTAETIRQLQDAAEAVADRGQAVEPLAEHPWRASRRATYSVREEEELADALEKTLSATTATKEAAARLEATLGLEAPRSSAALRQLGALARAAGEGALPAQALADDWEERAVHAKAWLAADAALLEEREALSERWEPALLDAALEPLHARYVRWADAFFLLAWVMLLGARRQLASLARGKLAERKGVRDDLGRAMVAKREAARLDAERTELQALLDAKLLERGDALAAAGLLPVDARRALAGRSASLSPERRALLSEQAAALDTCLDALEEGERSVRDLAQIPAGAAWPLGDDPAQLTGLESALRLLQEHLPAYRAHCLYLEAARHLEELGQGAVVAAFAEGRLVAAQVPAAFERNLLTRWLNAITDAEPALRTFDRPSQERLVHDFAALDRRHLELSRAYVIARAEERLPPPNAPAAAAGELQLLRREIAKKSRQIAVRRLLQSLPELLPRLKPCLLMSPLSVAQYLPPGARFDLLVFDEASQIGTHDAIGAIARGQQVVVVGDSKQLPPTAFFQRAGTEEDELPDENDVAELESILEEAQARGLPQQMLGWHYRSRHDSLIDFSNRHYYDGRLFVFPAARHAVEDLGVRWQHVPDGVFLSGKERVNRQEAVALVEHLVAQLRAYPPKERTFGVVTFSLSQRKLIEDMLDEARGEHPEIEAHFSSEEPVFVKNLENVQGDERDEILFSIGYARDDGGRLRMHFGPLSSKGGERRLNVAITRARKQLRVFSTLRPEDIDLSRTASIGAAHLRAFLLFAAGSATPTQIHGKHFESHLHREVHDALAAAGYEVATSVGCAGYRVDLAVERPDTPGTYALGIEFDGPRWARAETARDRERLRGEVLGSLGWHLARVWTPAWARDPEGERRRLLEAVEVALEAPPPVPPPTVPVEVVEVKDAAASGPKTGKWKRSPIFFHGLPEHFNEANPKVRERVAEVVAVEGPIHRDELFGRVAEAWRIGRMGARITATLERHLGALLAAGVVVRRGDFLWKAGADPADVDSIRLHEEDGSPRALEYFPPEEVALAATWIRQVNGALPDADLARETARFLGAQRPSQRMIDLILARLAEADRGETATGRP